MCGITGFTGKEEALPFLMQGLEKLEYRGYDSAGVTLVDKNGLYTIKTKGRLKDLENLLTNQEHSQTTGIGHTRWATHGVPSNLNSHPHTNADNTISIVHNGIIENYQAIKEELLRQGYPFVSQTDSEVIVHLIDYYNQGDLVKALQKAVRYLEGSFALCVVSKQCPDQIIVAKKESPMILGKSDQGTFCASDIPAVLAYTKDILSLEDGQIAILKPEDIQVLDFQGEVQAQNWSHVPYDLQAAQKGGYDTFMEKEIHEQPYVIKETLRGRLGVFDVLLPELDQVKIDWKTIERVYFIACGTAYNASMYAQDLFRTWMPKMPSFALAASEFRYGDYYVDENTICIFVSQSGETADTLAALNLAKEQKAHTISVVNVLDSSLARKSEVTLYTCAGPEIAVASTKAYTTQLVLLVCLVLGLVQHWKKTIPQIQEIVKDLDRMPEIIETILEEDSTLQEYAKLLKDKHDAYFIGRRLDYYSVAEGALKLKEISYVHADAYMAGELKHGPIALIEPGTVVVALATQEEVAAKTISNIEETMARGATVILITFQNQDTSKFDRVIRIPAIHPLLTAIPAAVLLQMFAYHAACIKGCDVDKPRNLAKSVTVE